MAHPKSQGVLPGMLNNLLPYVVHVLPNVVPSLIAFHPTPPCALALFVIEFILRPRLITFIIFEVHAYSIFSSTTSADQLIVDDTFSVTISHCLSSLLTSSPFDDITLMFSGAGKAIYACARGGLSLSNSH